MALSKNKATEENTNLNRNNIDIEMKDEIKVEEKLTINDTDIQGTVRVCISFPPCMCFLPPCIGFLPTPYVFPSQHLYSFLSHPVCVPLPSI